MSDEILTIEEHRGILIHDCQPRDRIEAVVKPEIDRVFAITDVAELMAYAADIRRPPEARLFAAAKARATYAVAANDRVVRPDVDLDRVNACVAGLNSRGWRDPSSYGSLLDVPHAPGELGPVRRPPEYAEQVKDDRRRRAEEERCAKLPPKADVLN